jgi:hypothetical protein
MTPYKSNYITFTRGSLSITVANGETTMVEGYWGHPRRSTCLELHANTVSIEGCVVYSRSRLQLLIGAASA